MIDGEDFVGCGLHFEIRRLQGAEIKVGQRRLIRQREKVGKMLLVFSPSCSQSVRQSLFALFRDISHLKLQLLLKSLTQRHNLRRILLFVSGQYRECTIVRSTQRVFHPLGSQHAAVVFIQDAL